MKLMLLLKIVVLNLYQFLFVYLLKKKMMMMMDYLNFLLNRLKNIILLIFLLNFSLLTAHIQFISVFFKYVPLTLFN